MRFAGGWIYDRVMAGWDVTVLVGDDEDVRPLEILGAETLDLESVLASWEERPHPQTVAVAADLFDRDDAGAPRRARRARAGCDRGDAVGRAPARRTRRAASIPSQHHFSAAARAFKAQALAAANDAAGGAVGDTETFRCGMMASVAADLIPAS